MKTSHRLRDFMFGAPRDPLNANTRHSLALAAFFAWVGLGADGLSSSAYGPEEAFRALGGFTHMSLFLALATAITVFVIALAYNQVIELFPTGGGGYRIATVLISPAAGLISGSALIVDYVLTVAISVASGVDALFSLLPLNWQLYKLTCETVLVVLLTWMNLRGAKESIRILMPIFIGFIVTHVLLIIYGIVAHANAIPALIPDTVAETRGLAEQSGWLFVCALFMKAYSLGGGTYTGIEAVSNNVQSLAEPRIRTGKLTMMYMAVSLAFMAAGLIVLYLLWEAKPLAGQTLNAVVFREVIADWGLGPVRTEWILVVVLVFEAGLLLVAANTGFLGGPSVLANMAADSWVPHKFRYLSSRLVTQHGIVLMGIGALLILWLTKGKVDLLVVLYSINVFLTFSLSLAGLCIYWWRHREQRHWRRRLLLSLTGLTVTASILCVTVVAKFFEGGWVTVLVTGVVVLTCLSIRRHYDDTKRRLQKIDDIFADQPYGSVVTPPALDPSLPTAVFLVGSHRGGGLHALLWVQRMFPDHFKNFIFVNVRTVDSQAYGGEDTLEALKIDAKVSLNYFVNFCHSHGLAAKSYQAFGTDAIELLAEQADNIQQEFPNAIFFSSKLVFENDHWYTRILHNQAALALQRRLHLVGQQMVILPMKV